MRSWRSFTRLLAFGVVLSIAGLAALGLYAFRNDLEALRKSTKENILWSAAQLEFELQRFIGALGEFGAGLPGADARMVNTRFDVLWSRVMLFRDGDAGLRLREYEKGAVAALFADMEAAEATIVGLADADAAAAEALVPVFRTHAEALRRVTIDVLHGEELKAAQMRDRVRMSAQLTALLSLAAVALSILAMILFSAESRRYRRLADANLRLAEEAEKANRAKSRFLTMMSHELRTPMNGVLGLLALAKQGGLPRPQLRLVEQAERSGREMIAMLSDILDFSALQDDELELERKPFSPRELGAAVADLFGPTARREGVSLSVVLDPQLPPQLLGDEARLRQVLTHLATYVIGTAATRGVELGLSHDGTSLVAALTFAYGDGGGPWRPDLILGAPEREADQFASDALGPAVARMLVARMGGTIRLGVADGERIAILVSAPAETLSPRRLSVAIETRSAAISMLCRAALRQEDIVVHAADAPGAVDAVLIEAGGEGELEAARAARARHPGARLVGLGSAVVPSAFDALVALPLDVARLRAAVVPLRRAS